MRIAIVHYTAPPSVGGVEAVLTAHTRWLLQAGHAVTIIAGDGAKAALPEGAELALVPEMASRHPEVLAAGSELEQGRVPVAFEQLAVRLADRLDPVLRASDWVIPHNIFTKHFNLPLTAALHRLLDSGAVRHCIAWCHDATWTSPHSRSKVHPGYPWDLLRTYRSDVVYVAVSRRRQKELSELFGCPAEHIRVIYNGVDPGELLGLSEESQSLVDQFNLVESDLVLLMPVRVTQAKNIEFALQVVAALKSRGLRPSLVVTGPPDPHDAMSLSYYRGLLALRRRLGVEQEVHFIYETSLGPGRPRTVEPRVVGDLFRVSDVMFMPSHREGFGMPVVEAGLVGLPVFCAAIPAGEEIGGEDVTTFAADSDPAEVASRLAAWAEASAVHRLRSRVRQSLTWDQLFRREILPLLEGRVS